MAELVLTVDVAAPAEATWAAAVDWEAQGEWMLGTKVWGTAQDGVGVGGGISGFTGIGKIGFLDTMVITAWEPPRRCLVRHTGRIVRGTGSFEVVALSPTTSRFVWSEWVDLPLGWFGQLGWLVAKPVTAAAVGYSLRKFGRYVEANQAAGAA